MEIRARPEAPFRTPLPTHHARVWSLAFGPDEADARLDQHDDEEFPRRRQVILRDMADGGRVHDLNGQKGIMPLVAFSPTAPHCFARR